MCHIRSTAGGHTHPSSSCRRGSCPLCAPRRTCRTSPGDAPQPCLLPLAPAQAIALLVLKYVRCRNSERAHPSYKRESPRFPNISLFGCAPPPPWRQPRGTSQVNLPPMLPPEGSICTGVDLRNHLCAPGLSPGCLPTSPGADAVDRPAQGFRVEG